MYTVKQSKEPPQSRRAKPVRWVSDGCRMGTEWPT